MTAERWRQVKDIFHRAVEYPANARAEFLRENCGGDEELLRKVEALLASDQEAGSLLESRGDPIVTPRADPLGDPMIGRALGNYVVTGELAHGGMGIVYRARHVTLPRDAVVKCIRPFAYSDEAQNDQLRARFRREAHIQSQLDHPHIVRVYEFFAGAGEYYLVMEYVPGSSIRSMLDKDGVLDVGQAIALTVQVLEGLTHAHNLHYVDELGNAGVGIIHRDIKPANLLVDEHGILKLTDFGIAQALGEGRLTKTGMIPGTAEYMSPEQIRGLPLDARSDLYSMGVTLYAMLTGKVPFPCTHAGSEYNVLKAHIETQPPSVRTVNPAISSSLADVVARSLEKDPARRWQSAAAFSDALVSCQEERPTRSAAYSDALPTRRYAVLSIVGAAVIAGVFWLGRGAKHFSAREQPSIAVLPFADMSPEKNQEYFSDGLAEELLNGLATTPGLHVAGRTSSFQFKGKTADFSDIGKKLHVGAILEGSVRKQGNRARISVQLIKAADGFHLWSETYDRELTDIFAVQEEIARAVTSALKVTLLAEKPAASQAKSTNAEAYNAYLQGRYFLARRNKDNLEKAVGYFGQAIQLDPGYAPAWAGLGESRSSQAMADWVPNNEGFRKAREAVARALVLGPDLGEAHATLGRIKMYHDLDWAGADASYQRALALEPGNAKIIGTAGALAKVLGRVDEAIALNRRALRIDPLSSSVYQNAAVAFYYAGRYEDATSALDKSIELAPEREIAHCVLAQIYLAQSRPREALAEAMKEKHSGFRLCALALTYRALNRKKESDASLLELIAK
ncbi:MAG: protein kinase, partial [Acidobacteriota bacterium]|nr:protein kinase [Acidobacteriota bacterium]